jgi:hypothetical protein
MNKFARLLLVLLTFSLALPLANAAILGNGQTGPPSFLTPTGTLLITTGPLTITTSTFTANYQQWVYSDPNNTFCKGCLDFVYQFTNKGQDGLERFTGFNFTGFRVDAGYDPTSSGQTPLSVNRNLLGDAVAFNYNGTDTLLPGQTTAMLVIETDALHYKAGTTSAQDGTAGFGFAYAPANAVPEPSSLAMLGSGVLAAAGVLRRKLVGVKKS